jgi:hypothetical protein
MGEPMSPDRGGRSPVTELLYGELIAWPEELLHLADD